MGTGVRGISLICGDAPAVCNTHAKELKNREKVLKIIHVVHYKALVHGTVYLQHVQCLLPLK